MFCRTLVFTCLTAIGFTTACFAQISSPETESTAALERLPEPLDGGSTSASESTDTSHTSAHVFPLVHYHRDGEAKKVKLGNAIVAHGYSHRTDGEGRERTAVLDVPFASLAKVKKDGDREKVRILNVPFASLMRSEKDGENSELKLVKVPFFALVDSEHEEDGQFDNKVIKLPIVGALFRHRRTEDKEVTRFLIFRHTKRLDKDDGEKENKRPRRQHRSHNTR